MNAIPDLTPPTGKTPKTPKVVNTDGTKVDKVAKVPKEPKAPKPEADPNAPKAPRAPRQDYGYRADATIALTADKDVTKLRGHRKAWYDKISAYNGKKVSEFTDANKENPKDPPRGWVRFFAQEGYITLSGGTDPAPKKVEEAPKAADTPPSA